MNQRMTGLVDQWKIREGRNNAEKARLKRQVEELTGRNAELQNQVRLMEQGRLEIRDHRNNAVKARLKRRVEDLTGQNAALQNQVRLMEQERLEHWSRPENCPAKVGEVVLFPL